MYFEPAQVSVLSTIALPLWSAAKHAKGPSYLPQNDNEFVQRRASLYEATVTCVTLYKYCLTAPAYGTAKILTAKLLLKWNARYAH